jgi:hypothetical protein
VVTGEFPDDAVPVPLILVVTAEAEDMEHDAAKAGLSEVSLHNRCGVLVLVLLHEIHNRNT